MTDIQTDVQTNMQTENQSGTAPLPSGELIDTMVINPRSRFLSFEMVSAHERKTPTILAFPYLHVQKICLREKGEQEELEIDLGDYLVLIYGSHLKIILHHLQVEEVSLLRRSTHTEEVFENLPLILDIVIEEVKKSLI